MENMKRSLSAGELPHLQKLVDELLATGEFIGDASLFGADPIIRSPHRLGEAAAIPQLLIALAAGAIWHHRTGAKNDASIAITDALHQMHSTHFVWQNGYKMEVGAEYVELNGVFLCRDGRYVMLEAGPPYPKLLKGYLDFFDCGNNRQSVAREVAKYDSENLETLLNEKGLPCCRAFTREEWLAQPQGQLLQRTPVVEIEKIADGPLQPWKKGSAIPMPLDGVRVLDFTHVLAGPRSTRALAELGADVLHISAPAFADTIQQHFGINPGKRNAYLDLRRPPDFQRMRELLRAADVFSSSYRHSVNERYELLPQQIATLNPNGMICLSVSAYGHAGSWAARPGFDQNGQVVAGFAVKEGEETGIPRFSPVFYLNDLLTGFFGTAGMLIALQRRAREGGSYHVKVSLTRTAMWVQDFGCIDRDKLAACPEHDTHPAKTVDVETCYGTLTSLENAVRCTQLPWHSNLPVTPPGSVAPAWQ